MPEAWEITTSDDRIKDQTITFIIFCEDENDEPYYFRSFAVEGKIKVNCIPNQKKAKLNLIKTLTYCNEVGLIECVEHTYKVKEGITENIWCVYDRDLEHTDISNIAEKDDINFTTAIQTAEQAGLKIAWSNDAFELWVLLHFETIPTGYRLHRNYIYDRLTEIFKDLTLVKKDYKALIDDNRFSYKLHLKKRVAFLNYVLPVLKEKVPEAIKNAEALEKLYKADVPYHNCNPCTEVHHLVNDIISAQL